MPKIYLIHGFTGSGKTTFSKGLALETGAIRLNIDEVMYEKHGDNPPAEKFSEYYALVEADLLTQAKNALHQGKDVIFDYGFWSYSSREKYRQFAASLKLEAHLYSLHADEKVMEDRVLKRTEKMIPGELVIDLNAIREFRKRFEPLRPDEKFVKVSSDV
jgi:predicted kinase